MSRHLTPRSICSTLVFSIFAAATASAQGQGVEASCEDLLQRGRLADAEQLLDNALKTKTADDDARFALGVVQFLRAVEGRMQAFHRHGYRSEPGMMPLSNLPIPKNPRPEPLDYKAGTGRPPGVGRRPRRGGGDPGEDQGFARGQAPAPLRA